MMISSIDLFFNRDCAGGVGPVVEAPKFGFWLVVLSSTAGCAAPLNKLDFTAGAGKVCSALVCPKFFITSAEFVVLSLSISKPGSFDKGADILKLLPWPSKALERPEAVEGAIDVGDEIGFENNEEVGPDVFDAPVKLFCESPLNNELLDVWADGVAPDEGPL